MAVLARAGLSPHDRAVLWLLLSCVVLALAWAGMRRAFAASADAWALSLNAFAALLISPISWSHHWVWGETAMLTLILLSRERRWRGGLVLAGCGLVLFAVAPQWWLNPSGHWPWWQQIVGSSYVLLAFATLLAAATATLCTPAAHDQQSLHTPRP